MFFADNTVVVLFFSTFGVLEVKKKGKFAMGLRGLGRVGVCSKRCLSTFAAVLEEEVSAFPKARSLTCCVLKSHPFGIQAKAPG